MRAADIRVEQPPPRDISNSTPFFTHSTVLIGLALVIIMLVGIYPNREEPHKADDQDADGKHNCLHRSDLRFKTH